MSGKAKAVVKRHPMVSFRADEALLDAIDRLAAAIDSDAVASRKRSQAIRRAIEEADKRLRPAFDGRK